MVLALDRTLHTPPGAPPPPPIPHLTCITLRAGHRGEVDDCPRAELWRFLEAVLTGQPYTVPDTRRYFIATDLTHHPVGTAVALPTQTTLPFSITVPYRLRHDQWAALAACGQIGTTYTATLADTNGVPVFSTGAKTFGQHTTTDFDFDGVGTLDPECDVLRLDQAGGWGHLLPGTYRWSFTFDGHVINPGNLSYHSSDPNVPTVATTIVDATQPLPGAAVFDPVGFITMGVDEF
jgi:hypothetical protein